MKKWILLTFMFIAANLLVACNQTSVSFTINFDSNGGTLVDPIKVGEESTITLPTDPEKEGFVFAGWYWDNNTFRDLFTLNSLQERGISSNLTVFAKWILEDDYIPIGSVKVTFNSNGGSEVAPVYVMPGNTIIIPQVSREGHTLEGWYTSVNGGVTFDERWSFTNNTVNNDITLFAKWNVNQYTITFDSNGGTPISAITQDYARLVSEPIKPTRLGYTFQGWYSDEGLNTPYKFISTPSINIILYAKWVPNQYTIRFESNGGSNADSITQDFSTEFTFPSPIKEGYIFIGWFRDMFSNTPYTTNIVPSQDITLFAKWEAIEYNIDYYLFGGVNGLNPSVYSINTPTISFKIPTKEGYTFIGWYDNPEFSGEKIVKLEMGNIGDKSFYAQWSVNEYKITYNIYDDYDPLEDIPLEAGEFILDVSLGVCHSAAITSKGRVFTWGCNLSGQLGDGTTSMKLVPTDITKWFGLKDGELVSEVSLAYSYSSAITSFGRVFTWGNNSKGQLGDGSTNSSLIPIDITKNFKLITDEKVTNISLGNLHSAAVTSNGRIFIWGNNDAYQLGFDNYYFSSLPIDITNLFDKSASDKITQVSLGHSHSAALTSSGKVFTWGKNTQSQLGNGTMVAKKNPTRISFSIGFSGIITKISMKNNQSAAMTSTGKIFIWGTYAYGSESDGDILSITNDLPTLLENGVEFFEGETLDTITLGSNHGAVITTSGRLLVWGDNKYGKLGNGSIFDSFSLMNVTNRFVLSSNEKIVKVSLGSDHSSIVTSDGRLFIWGYNSYGNLGNGTTKNSMDFIQLGFVSPKSSTTSSYKFGETIELYSPTNEGYTFDGWYINPLLTIPYVPTSMPANDIILYARRGHN